MDLTQQQWIDQQKEHQAAVILDVRTPNEFEEKHIPNAQLLDINDPPAFMAGLEGLDP
ncbi:MAG: rhodanese-like domain-containing protein, partial [Flavobacteriales bacterium]